MSFTALDAPDLVAKQAGPIDFTSLYKGKAFAIRGVACASIRAGLAPYVEGGRQIGCKLLFR